MHAWRGEFDRWDVRRAVGERFMSMHVVDEQALTSYSTGAMNCVYEVTHFREAIRGAWSYVFIDPALIPSQKTPCSETSTLWA